MIYLTKEEIIAINRHQVFKFGGNFVPPNNFLHEKNLDYVVEAVQAEMFGAPLYAEPHQKAAVYLYNIICNHIFSDGNKRTGLQAAIVFLRLNGCNFTSSVTDELLINFTLSVASGEQSLEQVQKWFEEYITPLP